MIAATDRLRVPRAGMVLMWCPGCMKAHQLPIGEVDVHGKTIGWDGDRDTATIEPEMRFRGCEFYVRAGDIHFSQKCRHALVGQTVRLPHFPLS